MNKVTDFCEKYGIERRNTSCGKWDGVADQFGDKDLLPMWVADMEFAIPDEAKQAMIERVNHGAFGYTMVGDSYYEAFFKWEKERYDIHLEKEWFRFSTGIVNAFFWLICALTKKEDSVIVLTPVYYPFFNAINDTDRTLITSSLKNEDGVYSIDYEDFEQKIIQNKVKVFLHCSPHNPVGRVWKKKELEKLFNICIKHGVKIISDEIHQDLTRKDVQFVGALALDSKYQNHIIVLNAPSKTFNMAGLLHSHVIIPNEDIRQAYDEYAKKVNHSTISVMGMVAAEACYKHGSEWLEGLLAVIEHNYQLLKDMIAKDTPKIIMSEKQGTYLAWLDLRGYISPKDTKEFIQDNCRLAVDFGEWFSEEYQGFIRLNLGTEPKHIEEAVKRITKAVREL